MSSAAELMNSKKLFSITNHDEIPEKSNLDPNEGCSYFLSVERRAYRPEIMQFEMNPKNNNGAVLNICINT
jgi:hypothetical protein